VTVTVGWVPSASMRAIHARRMTRWTLREPVSSAAQALGAASRAATSSRKDPRSSSGRMEPPARARTTRGWSKATLLPRERPSVGGRGRRRPPAHGQRLPIATNTALFSLLGTPYGGDGITTFALPDLRPVEPKSANGIPLTYTLRDSGIDPARD